MTVSGTRRMLIACAAAALTLCVSSVIAGSAWGWGFKVSTVASGLDNPRDLAFGQDGKLYVAEAGHGGSECVTIPEFGTECVGFTSAVSRVDQWGVHRVVSGLFSIASPDGSGATGVDGISFFNGRLFGIETLSSDAVSGFTSLSPQTLAKAKSQAGRLGERDLNGHVRAVADVGHFDFQWSKEHPELVPGQFPDANPYGVLATQWGELVVDAGSNTLDFVSPNGKVQILAFFPNPPSSDAVPTCLDRGPDGAIYVGELTGGGNAPGASVVWRWTPGHQPTVWARGLTAVTGCGFAADGQFYAVELSTLGLDKAAPGTGALVRVPPFSTKPTTIVSGLNFPGGFAADSNSVYLSNWSVAPAQNKGGPTGQVLRVSHS